jgi:Raf kinase inhibitor-like YbhB/YbcL family protein
MKGIAPALALIVLAGCAAKTQSNETANDAIAKLSLTSAAFRDGQAIPTQFTCDGANKSPPLAWDEPAKGTKSFALILDDPDAPGGTFRHWGAFDISAAARSIPAGQAAGAQAINSKSQPGYTGPCPPKGNGPHHYRFKLYALGVEHLGLAPSAKVEQVENEAQKHLLGEGKLTATYERP